MAGIRVLQFEIDWLSFNTRAPVDHPALNDAALEAFAELGSDAIIPQLTAYDEPVFKAVERQFGADPTKFNPAKLRQMIIKRNQLQKDYLDRWVATQKNGEPLMDGIISPVAPLAANRLGFTETEQYISYTVAWNLLGRDPWDLSECLFEYGANIAPDYSACTFPVTYASQSIDVKRGAEWQPLSELDKLIQSDYDAEFYDGAPVSLQLVGKRLEEEKVLEMVEVVSNALKEAGY